jgi:SAM-dependent methyltransferase
MNVEIDTYRRRLRPEGVDGGLWAYVTSTRLAEEETEYFADHPLCGVDLAWISQVLGEGPGLAADFGCGSGRASAVLAAKGWDVLAVDLSRPMLERVRLEHGEVEKASSGSVVPIQANLARLGFLPEASLDAAVCLFSTLGMLVTPESRQRFLGGVGMALKPGGVFLLHAHNWWVQKATGEGRRWMVRDLVRRAFGRADFGNRAARYRVIPDVAIHMFTWPEVERELLKAGLRVRHVTNLDAENAEDLGIGGWTRHVFAGGWLIESEKIGK